MQTEEQTYESFLEEHQENPQNRALVVYEEPRSELEIEEELSIQAILSGEFWPIHLQEWENLPDDLIPDKEELLSIYLGSSAIRQVDAYYGKDLLIHGSIMRYYPPFNSKPDANGISIRKAGYYRAMFWTNLKDEYENPIVIAMSAQGIGTHLSILLKRRGWYLWRDLKTNEPTPQIYRFSRPGGRSIQMMNVKLAEERAKSSK